MSKYLKPVTYGSEGKITTKDVRKMLMLRLECAGLDSLFYRDSILPVTPLIGIILHAFQNHNYTGIPLIL